MSTEYEQCLGAIGPAALDVLTGLEVVARRLDPPAIPALKDRLRPYVETLETSIPAFREFEAPGGLEGFHARFLEGAETAARAAIAAATGYAEQVRRDVRTTESLRRRTERLGRYWGTIPELAEDVHDLAGLGRVADLIFEHSVEE